MSLCDKCISGVRHQGTPEGREEVINGVRTYVATPSGKYSEDKVVLYLPDVFGIELENARLLSDDFARSGFKVYAIDFLFGDPIPPDVLGPGSTFDFPKWLSKHGQDVTRPYINKVIDGLKAQGVTQFGATGYCFGARYAFDLAFDGAIKVAVVAHPSLLKVPEDLQRFKESGVPLLINSCETDKLFPQEAQKLADEILGGGTQESALYKREYYAGLAHGFAVRGDLSNPVAKAGKEDAFKASVAFFKKHL